MFFSFCKLIYFFAFLKDIHLLKGKVLLDVGAAEAIFALNAIDLVEKAYLFECEKEWIDALELTFAPWKYKVEIVHKYVSDRNNGNHITIDNFLEEKSKKNLFIKMDIEGYEQAALKGATKTFDDKAINFITEKITNPMFFVFQRFIINIFFLFYVFCRNGFIMHTFFSHCPRNDLHFFAAILRNFDFRHSAVTCRKKCCVPTK